jgi:hypothetical protein
MNVYLVVFIIALLIAIYRVIRTFLVQHSVEHGMTEHEAQRRYDNLFSLLWTRHREKTTDVPDVPKNESETPKRVQTRWTSIGTNVRKER